MPITGIKMKTRSLLGLVAVSALQITGCSTYIDANGQQKTGLTPEGAAVLQTALATAIGTGAGALMGNQPGWATGMVSGASASAISQMAVSAIPRAPRSASQYQQQYSPPYPMNYQMQQMQNPGTYNQLFTQGRNGQLIPLAPSERQLAAQLNLPVFARTANGQFVRLY